jgi:phenylacetate-CoA ligase
VQNLLVSAYGYYWKERRMGGVFETEFKKAKERENFTAEQWAQYQDAQLQKILLHAYDHVSYYRENYSAHGLNREALKNISAGTLNKLPILSKEDLRKYGTSTLISDAREKSGHFFESSGSTGTPTQILFSTAMHQRWFALLEQRVRNWAGVSSVIPRGMIGGRRIIPNANNQPPFYRYNFFEKQVYFSAYHINAKNAANYLEGIKQYSIEYMTGYAMSNFFLARFFKEQEMKLPSLKAVVTSSEKLTAEMRQVFKDVYDCKTYDGWSGLEACGLVSECEHGSLHISPDAAIIEVLDKEQRPVETGVAGEVYCTGFVNYDQPLIRYAIGDEMILSNNKCSCRRAMPVVQEIVGRTEDVVISSDGREMVRFHSVFNGLHSVKKAQVIQETAGNILIKVVTTGNLLKADAVLIEQRIESQLGKININILEVEEIPLNKNGKFQAVISRIKGKPRNI